VSTLISEESLAAYDTHRASVLPAAATTAAVCSVAQSDGSRLFSDGYTADQVIYMWSGGNEYKALKLNAIRLPDFKLTEAYVTSKIDSYTTGADICFTLLLTSSCLAASN
jgi:hypothetical protein